MSIAGGKGHQSGSSGRVETGSLGRSIAPFSASAVDNTTYHSADHKEQVLVVAFLGVECPLANLYDPVRRLCEEVSGQVGRFSRRQLECARFTRCGADSGPGQRNHISCREGCRQYSRRPVRACRTPEIFVLDAQRTECYRGMLDDQCTCYRGERRSKPTKAYVADAVNSLLQSKSVAVAETEVQGCHIGRVTRPSETAKSSYYRDVLPILQNRCQQCHRKGEIGPFRSQIMRLSAIGPPRSAKPSSKGGCHPGPRIPRSASSRTTSASAIRRLLRLRNGSMTDARTGDVAEKPPEKQFIDGRNIGHPDRTYTMAEPYHVPATGVVEYKNFVVSVFTKDTWVQGVECRFGNRTVVHHMLVLLDFPQGQIEIAGSACSGGFFAAGVPGASYYLFPEGYAKKIPKGARLRFQMHYTPNGTAANDQSKFGILLAKGNSFKK